MSDVGTAVTTFNGRLVDPLSRKFHLPNRKSYTPRITFTVDKESVYVYFLVAMNTPIIAFLVRTFEKFKKIFSKNQVGNERVDLTPARVISARRAKPLHGVFARLAGHPHELHSVSVARRLGGSHRLNAT